MRHRFSSLFLGPALAGRPSACSLVRYLRGPCLLAALLVMAVTIAASSQTTSQATPQAARPGPATTQAPSGGGLSEKCATCHEDVVKHYLTTRHGKAEKFGTAGYESCASCHGDVTAHAESGDPSKIFNPRKTSLPESSAKCLACHGNEHNRAFWESSRHATSNTGCLSCHSVHHAKSAEKLLLARSEVETCVACHTEQRKARIQRSTHLFRDELRRATMQCSDCHNPHGSQTPKMLRANSINDTCYACHTEKRGPFLWQHSPVQENCLNCHTPHGSNNQFLLSQRTPQLCHNCHIQGKHQTVSGFANSAWIFNRNCLNCHNRIHGSNHPSGLKLQR
jgi:DmsE family decaheme c-type cytochrome